MHAANLLLLLGALVAASPVPQDIDIDGIIADGPPPEITYATRPTVISVNPTALASEAAAAITANPLTAPPATSILPSSLLPLADAPSSILDLEKRVATGCASASALPTGAGPVPKPDTASAFLADSYFASVASAAPTPSGYSLAFTNLQAENQAYAYLGFSLLQSYDTAGCAAQCNAIYGCMAINVAFERAPSVNPQSGCDNPPSTTLIKCVFWGSPVTVQNAQNSGQLRDKFQVVIAGSNGYVNNSYPSVPKYNGPTYLGNATINAPLDCNGDYTYMGYVSWNDGKPFDPSRCAAACTAQSNYNIAHPPSDGSAPTTCQFFNTYYLLKNGAVQAQVCSLYNETWNATWATNTGYFYGSDVYTVESSVTYSNATNPGTCVPAPTNLVANGDFSLGYKVGWTATAMSGANSYQNGQNSYDGNGAVMLSCGDPLADAGNITYKNTAATVTGQKYAYSFRYYYQPGENNIGGGSVKVQIPEAGASLAAPPVSNWGQSSGTFVATGSVSTFQIVLTCPKFSQIVLDVDDVVVIASS